MDAAKIAIRRAPWPRHMQISACWRTGRTRAFQARQLIVLRVPVARIALEEALCANFEICVLKRVTTKSTATTLG